MSADVLENSVRYMETEVLQVFSTVMDPLHDGGRTLT